MPMWGYTAPKPAAVWALVSRTPLGSEQIGYLAYVLTLNIWDSTAYLDSIKLHVTHALGNWVPSGLHLKNMKSSTKASLVAFQMRPGQCYKETKYKGVTTEKSATTFAPTLLILSHMHTLSLAKHTVLLLS